MKYTAIIFTTSKERLVVLEIRESCNPDTTRSVIVKVLSRNDSNTDAQRLCS